MNSLLYVCNDIIFGVISFARCCEFIYFSHFGGGCVGDVFGASKAMITLVVRVDPDGGEAANLGVIFFSLVIHSFGPFGFKVFLGYRW